jgi:cation transport regulator ChaB
MRPDETLSPMSEAEQTLGAMALNSAWEEAKKKYDEGAAHEAAKTIPPHSSIALSLVLVQELSPL